MPRLSSIVNEQPRPETDWKMEPRLQAGMKKKMESLGLNYDIYKFVDLDRVAEILEVRHVLSRVFLKQYEVFEQFFGEAGSGEMFEFEV